jgi:hypothetical protein
VRLPVAAGRPRLWLRLDRDLPWSSPVEWCSVLVRDSSLLSGAERW